jgi:hypothetical protein
MGAEEAHRPAVFLTNALTGWHDPDELKLNFPPDIRQGLALERLLLFAKAVGHPGRR